MTSSVTSGSNFLPCTGSSRTGLSNGVWNLEIGPVVWDISGGAFAPPPQQDVLLSRPQRGEGYQEDTWITIRCRIVCSVLVWDKVILVHGRKLIIHWPRAKFLPFINWSVSPPPEVIIRALQWSGNPYGNGYGLEMDGNGAQFMKMLWIGLDLGEDHRPKTIQ